MRDIFSASDNVNKMILLNKNPISYLVNITSLYNYWMVLMLMVWLECGHLTTDYMGVNVIFLHFPDFQILNNLVQKYAWKIQDIWMNSIQIITTLMASQGFQDHWTWRWWEGSPKQGYLVSIVIKCPKVSTPFLNSFKNPVLKKKSTSKDNNLKRDSRTAVIPMWKQAANSPVIVLKVEHFE